MHVPPWAYGAVDRGRSSGPTPLLIATIPSYPYPRVPPSSFSYLPSPLPLLRTFSSLPPTSSSLRLSFFTSFSLHSFLPYLHPVAPSLLPVLPSSTPFWNETPGHSRAPCRGPRRMSYKTRLLICVVSSQHTGTPKPHLSRHLPPFPPGRQDRPTGIGRGRGVCRVKTGGGIGGWRVTHRGSEWEVTHTPCTWVSCRPRV